MADYSLKVFNRRFTVPEYALIPSNDVQGAPYAVFNNILGVFPYSSSQTSFVQNLIWYDATGNIRILPPATGVSGNQVVHSNFGVSLRHCWIEFAWCLDGGADDPDQFESTFAVEVVIYSAATSSGVTSTRLYDRVLMLDKTHPVRFEIPDVTNIAIGKEKSVFVGVNFVPIALSGDVPVIESGNFTVNSEFCVIADPQYTPTSS